MAKRGRGRPRLPKGSALASRLYCRLRPDEQKQIEQVAIEAGMNVSEWIRKVLLAAADSKVVPTENKPKHLPVEPTQKPFISPEGDQSFLD